MVDLSGILVNGTIPLSLTIQSTTNWGQYVVSAVIGLLSIFGIFLVLYLPRFNFFFGGLMTLSRLSKRNIVMIKHTEASLFSQSMIDQNTLRDMSLVMNKMKGEDFDLILHTPGGDIFSSLALSRLLKQYKGQIRAIVPLYSMSGGSLLALSCKEIAMTPNASIGPIDPQLGNFFRYGSAKGWEHIVKFKGKKAEDQSINFAMIGKQYTKSIQNHLKATIDFNMSNNQKEKLVQFLTDGNIEHAYPLTITDLQRFGLAVNTITEPKYLKSLIKIISSKGKEGVTYHKIPSWRK